MQCLPFHECLPSPGSVFPLMCYLFLIKVHIFKIWYNYNLVRARQCAPVLKKPAGNTEISTKAFDFPSPEKCLSKIQGFTSFLSFSSLEAGAAEITAESVSFCFVSKRNIFKSAKFTICLHPTFHTWKIWMRNSPWECKASVGSKSYPSQCHSRHKWIHTYPALSRTYTLRCVMHVNWHWHAYSWAQLSCEAEFLSSDNQI